MSFYTDGKMVVDAIVEWANKNDLSISQACLKLNVNTQSFYGWAHGQRVTERVRSRIESEIGPIKPPKFVLPEGKVLVDAEAFNSLYACLNNAHENRKDHIDMAISVDSARVFMDKILDIQAKEL